jgi:hypothetical protein
VCILAEEGKTMKIEGYIFTRVRKAANGTMGTGTTDITK